MEHQFNTMGRQFATVVAATVASFIYLAIFRLQLWQKERGAYKYRAQSENGRGIPLSD